MTTQYFTQEDVRKIERAYSMIPINDTYCVFKVSIVESDHYSDSIPTNNDKHEVVSRKDFQGVSTIHAFNNALENKCVPVKTSAYILTDEFLGVFKRFGFYAFSRPASSGKTFVSNGSEIRESVTPSFDLNDYVVDSRLNNNDHSNAIFDVVSGKPELLDSIYLFNFEKNRITNTKGDLIPLAYYFDSDSGGTDDSRYSLDKLSQWIKNRHDVTVIPSGMKHITNTPEKLYKPAYRKDDDGNELDHIVFYVSPTKEEYEAICARIDREKGFISFYDAIDDIDAFKLSSCLK